MPGFDSPVRFKTYNLKLNCFMDKQEMIRQIRKGSLNEFSLDGETCNVHRKANGNFIVERKNGQKGETKYIGSTTDLYGIVCFLRQNNVNYHKFDC